jgi:putative cell wall-binding protein
MNKTKSIAILAVVAMLLMAVPAQLFAITSTLDSLRLAGLDRVGTALESSVGWTSADNVVLAPADQVNLVDSLSAAPLAGQEKAPILLTFKNSLDTAVKDRIVELKAKKVFVIGAVTDAVVDQLKTIAGLDVEVLRGANRWATSDLINAKLVGVAGTFVVGYNAIPDALSAASFAAANNYQIVLTDASGNADPAKLKGTAYIIGGTGVVNDIPAVSATRLGGADRYATNSRVIEALAYDFNKVYVANGASLVDALAASSLAALTRSPIFLTNGATVPALTNAAVTEKVTAGTAYIALGGTGAVSENVMNSIGADSTGPIVVNTVQGVEESFNVRTEGQYLGVRINNSQKVTAAQLDAAGYDVLFTAGQTVFDGSSESDTGELDQGEIQGVYDGGDDTFDYTVSISKKSEVIAESDSVDVTLYDGRTTAASGISSYRLDLIEDNQLVLSQGLKSNTLIVGETAGFWSVKAKTISGGTDVDITNSIKLSSSDPWVVDVNDDNDNAIRASTPTSANLGATRDYTKWFNAVGIGKATITITSGTVTESFTITVRDPGDDDGRVAAKATLETNTLKLAVGGGYDYTLVKFTDQYGDPFAKWDQIFYDKNGASVDIGSFAVEKTVSGAARLVATASQVSANAKGELLLHVETAQERTSTEYLSFYGYKWEGASTFRELGKIKLDVGASGTVDPTKSKFVAANSDALDFTVDQNAFEAPKITIKLHLMKYTSNGYALGAFTSAEYNGSWNDTESGTMASGAPRPSGAFTLSTNREGFIQQPTGPGSVYPSVPISFTGTASDEINVTVEIPAEYQNFKTGSVQIQAKIKKPGSDTVTTKSQNIKVVNTTAQITKITYENIDEMSGGDYQLDELLLFDNIVTDKTLGDGVLRAVASGAGDYVSFFYQNEAGTTVQEIGRLVTNQAGVGIVSFAGGASDDPADISITVTNAALTANKTIQFAVKRYGSNSNIATKSVKILKP